MNQPSLYESVSINWATEYLRRAELTREQAERIQSPELKASFLKVAAEWERMAEAALR